MQLYECPYCHNKYLHLSGLKSHVIKTHLLYGLVCPYCNTVYGTLQKLQYHLLAKDDELHKNFFYLITRKYRNKINKKLLLAN